jgi:hypothetical protein
MPPIFICGDIHGQLSKLLRLLRENGLVRANLSWNGADARIWFMGDFVDRGPDGIPVVDLVMRLQREAEESGGGIGALMGNHELLFLAAHRFGKRGGFRQAWVRNGGEEEDMARANVHHVAWMQSLPAMARISDKLLMHADAIFYTSYGKTVEQVNAAFRRLMFEDNMALWETMLDNFSERFAFHERVSLTPNYSEGGMRAEQMLNIYGGSQIVHGHTPIAYMRDDLLPELVRTPLIYANARCVNVDGGMFMGGPGFLYRLPTM